MNKILFTILSLFNIVLVAQQRTDKPNIIYIYADDLGYGELGVYGQKLIKTPHLDQMAKEGIKFTQHYASSPVCAPARGALLTGKHAGHTYIRGNYELGGFSDSTEGGQMPLPEGTFTIPRMLKTAGYKTAIIGKWGLGMPFNSGNPNKHGFDYSYGYLDQKQAHNYYPTHLWENGKWDTLHNKNIAVHQSIKPEMATDTDFQNYEGIDYAPIKMTQKALAFIEQNKNQPFFLYLPYTLPHLGLQAPKEWVQKYIGKFKEEEPYYGQKGYNPCKYPLSTYAAMISFLDEQVGLVLEKIKNLGLDENTIIMFSSDNGATFDVGGVRADYFKSVQNLKGLKMDIFEGGIREPFIARWVGKIKPNTESDLISAQYDMMATLAELTQTIPNNTDGISLVPTLLGQPDKQKKHDYLYFEYHERNGQIAIRMDDWKGVKVGVSKNINTPWMLFNLKDDIAERHDIADKHPDIILRLNEIQKREHQGAHLVEWEFINDKTKNKEKTLIK